MDVSQNIELFQELVRCGGEISLWRYDGSGNLLSSMGKAVAYLGVMFGVGAIGITDNAGMYYLLTSLVLFWLSWIFATQIGRASCRERV